MKEKINGYGKTWHTWSTATTIGGADRLPKGDAHLAWSFNRDGEAMPGLVERRDERMGIGTDAKREAAPRSRATRGRRTASMRWPAPSRAPAAGRRASSPGRTAPRPTARGAVRGRRDDARSTYVTLTTFFASAT